MYSLCVTEKVVDRGEQELKYIINRNVYIKYAQAPVMTLRLPKSGNEWTRIGRQSFGSFGKTSQNLPNLGDIQTLSRLERIA